MKGRNIERPASNGNWQDRFFLKLAGGMRGCSPELQDSVWTLLMRWGAGVVTASICSISVWIAAAMTLSDSWPYYFIAADLLLAGVKMHFTRQFPSANRLQRSRIIGRLMICSLLWGLMLGYGGGLCIATGDITLSVIATGVMAAGIGVISFRNAPTPLNACLLILCVIVPPSLAAYYALPDGLKYLGVWLVPWSLCLFWMVRQNFEVIKASSLLRLKLNEMAHTDPLTELRNRLAFNDHIAQLRDEPNLRDYTLLYLDLDGFKQVNDTYGHEVGDALLIAVARRMRAVTREYDTLFRLGGDEFALMLEDMAPREIEAVITRLIKTISQPFILPNVAPITVGVSIGSARSEGNEVCPSEVLRAADQALYTAKAAGRGRHVPANWEESRAH